MNITLQGKQINIIRFFRGYIELDRNNQKPGACRDCSTHLDTGEGVYRKAYLGNGFICFNCVRAELLVRTYDLGFPQGDAGFHFDKAERTLSQCYTGFPKREFRTLEVIAAVRHEWMYEIVERSIGPDITTSGKLEDAIIGL